MFVLSVDVCFVDSTIVYIRVHLLTHMLKAIKTANASQQQLYSEHWLCFLHDKYSFFPFLLLFFLILLCLLFVVLYFSILQTLQIYHLFTYSLIVHFMTGKKEKNEAILL